MKDETYFRQVVAPRPPKNSGEKAAGNEKSKSGLYLEGLDGLQAYLSHDGTGAAEKEKHMQQALNEAARYLMEDIRHQVFKSKATAPLWNGRIGQVSGISARAINRAYAGVTIIGAARGFVLKINEIGTLFNKSGAVEAKLLDADCRVLSRFELKTSKRRHYLNKAGLRLPFTAKENRKYHLIYKQEDYFPLDNKINCGCGQFKPTFEPTAPRFHPYEKGGNTWAAYINIGGFSGHSSSEDAFEYRNSKYMNGLSLNISLEPDMDDRLFPGEADFAAQPPYADMATALQLRAAVILAERCSSLTTPARQKQLNTWAAQWYADYRKRLENIAEAYSTLTA